MRWKDILEKWGGCALRQGETVKVYFILFFLLTSGAKEIILFKE